MPTPLPKLHAAIAHAGVTSRRKAEALILAGRVKVDGVVVNNVAARVDPHKQAILVDGGRLDTASALVYYLLNKPVGFVSTVSDPDNKPTVISLVPSAPRVYLVGRLDEDSEGLMLLTNDGELTNILTHPKFEVKKTYHVLVEGAPSNTALNTLRAGVKLKEGRTSPAEVAVIKHEQGRTWIRLTIHEGWNRQIRRICAQVGLTVMRLLRVELGPFTLGELQSKKHRLLTDAELKAVEKLKTKG